MPTAIPDPEYLLRGVAGGVFGRSYPLMSPTTVGRAPECDLYLDDAGISRQHARLRPLDYGIEVQDLGSTNGSFINGQRVTTGIAGIGDEIAFDQLRFRVGHKRASVAASTATPPTAKRARPMTLTWVTAGVLLAAGVAAYLLTR